MRLVRTVVSFAIGALTAAACGGESETASTGTGSGGANSGGISGASDAGATGGMAGDSGGASGFGGLVIEDAAKDVATDPGVLAEAGYFDCAGCLCPGDTHYCLFVAAGALSPLPPPDGATCADVDGGEQHCLPLPSACNGIPSCACVLDMPACYCEDSGGGLTVHCALP